MNLGGKIFSALLLAATAAGALGGTEPAKPAALRKVTVALNGIASAKFIGFYYASDNGIYARNGLDVEFIYGRDAAKPSLDYLKNGEAQFAVSALAPAIRFSASGWEIVNICQLMQRTGMIVAASRERGIYSFRDLDGRKIAISPWDDRGTLEKLLLQRGIRAEMLPPTGEKLELFLNHAADAVAGMYYFDYKFLLDSGVDPDEIELFRLSDVRPYIPEDGIYVLDSLLKLEPGLCTAFVAATIEGYAAAFGFDPSSPEIDGMLKKYLAADDAAFSRSLQRWMFSSIKSMMMPDGSLVDGRLDEKDYLNMVRIVGDSKSKPYREFFRYYPTLGGAE